MRTEEMTLANLIATCREETGKFMRRVASQDIFCFELFRRAIQDRDQSAWAAVFTQYQGMVAAWVHTHPASAATAEGDDYWVNRTFERFWTAVQPERLASFPGMAALLRYLKLCAHSVLLDEVRARQATKFISLSVLEESAATVTDVATDTIDQLSTGALWQAIRAEIQDEAEGRVAYLCLVLGMKPREIYDRYPDQFPSVNDVYRIKRNLFDRLARSPTIRGFRA